MVFSFTLSSLQAVGLPAKQGLFRNVSSTVTQCKALLDWQGNEADLTELQSTSVCPVVMKNKKLFYEVEVDEKKKQVSSEDALVHVYKKLYGMMTLKLFCIDV